MHALLVVRLTFGHWSRSQHIFIDPERPSSAYGMAYNCLACPDNAVTFNDGYHIQHHLNSKAHWSDLPQRFLDTLDEHARHQGELQCDISQRLTLLVVGNFSA